MISTKQRIMFRNYVAVALRSIARNKLTSFINIFGLALAMTCALLIYLFIQDELSYDRHNAHADRIYRVTRNFLSKDGSVNLHLGHVAPPFGPLLKNDFGEFEEVARTFNITALFSYEEDGRQQKVFNEEKLFVVEPALFKIFTIPTLKGDPEKVLSQPLQLMLSASAARKYFGDNDPMGKTLRINSQFDGLVGGVFADFPKQSHFHPEIFLSFETLNDSTIYGRRGLETNWGNNSFVTYILATHPLDINAIEQKFPAFLDRHMPTSNASDPKASSWTTLFLQKVSDIHLYSHLDSEQEANGNINTVYMLGVIALFIILIACFNFINLSTARASKRAKEVGLRKVAGAFKIQLINQFLSESVMIAAFALILTLVFSSIATEWLSEFTGKSLSLNLLTDPNLAAGLIGFAVTVGLLAGIYPAFVLSAFRPALILKAHSSQQSKGFLRRVLVVTQFAVSIVLIIATAITLQQLNFMNERDLGYTKDQVATLPNYPEFEENYDAFYNELTRQAPVKNASRSSRIPTGRLLDSQGSAKVQVGDSLEDNGIVLKNIRIDQEFFDTYGIALAAGRNFSKARISDDSASFIVNEAAARMLGLTNDEIINKEFHYGDTKGKVVGVVKDFHFESLHEPIIPIVFEPQGGMGRISVKLSGTDARAGIAAIERIWHEFAPNRPFEFEFVSQRYQNLYDEEQRQSQLFITFAGLAILIACLGLFGLATFNAEQRTKEIGIRKVLGASVPGILALLSREILILIAVANLIAWPVAWYTMREWLNGFAYHVEIGIGVFALSALAAIVLALVTVSSQSLRAARSNPATTLRYE